jgi:hypothetical protein
MEIGNGTEAPVDTTLISTTRTLRAERPDAGLLRSAAVMLGRVRTAIVNGPSDGCWRSVDGATQLSLLPARERERLLAAGRVPRWR